MDKATAARFTATGSQASPAASTVPDVPIDRQEIENIVRAVLDREPKRLGARATSYTVATQPAATAVAPGTIVFVSDAAAGSKFQGSTGAAWVSLG